jgi:hypothetical protein
LTQPDAEIQQVASMSKSLAALFLAILVCQPALSADLGVHANRSVSALPPERHVIEIVRPPYSGSFIINAAAFTAKTPACWNWAAGERVKLVAGDWHGRCIDAVFYNVTLRRSCAMWCG